MAVAGEAKIATSNFGGYWSASVTSSKLSNIAARDQQPDISQFLN
jgi:hypothetical protein